MLYIHEISIAKLPQNVNKRKNTMFVPNPLQKADWSAVLVCCCRSWAGRAIYKRTPAYRRRRRKKERPLLIGGEGGRKKAGVL